MKNVKWCDFKRNAKGFVVLSYTSECLEIPGNTWNYLEINGNKWKLLGNTCKDLLGFLEMLRPFEARRSWCAKRRWADGRTSNRCQAHRSLVAIIPAEFIFSLHEWIPAFNKVARFLRERKILTCCGRNSTTRRPPLGRGLLLGRDCGLIRLLPSLQFGIGVG